MNKFNFKIDAQVEIMKSICKFKDDIIVGENNQVLFNKQGSGFRVSKLFKSICAQWNKNEKSRGFIKHLIYSFLPADYGKITYMLVTNEEKDAITDKKLTSIFGYVEGTKELVFKRASFDCATTEDEKQKAIEEYNDLIKSLPIEIKNKMFCMFSDKSDKYLSPESLTALSFFVTEGLLRNVDGISFILNKQRFKTANKKVKNKLTDKEINKLSRKATYRVGDNLDANTVSKLAVMKSEFNTKNN